MAVLNYPNVKLPSLARCTLTVPGFEADMGNFVLKEKYDKKLLSEGSMPFSNTLSEVFREWNMVNSVYKTKKLWKMCMDKSFLL